MHEIAVSLDLVGVAINLYAYRLNRSPVSMFCIGFCAGLLLMNLCG